MTETLRMRLSRMGTAVQESATLRQATRVAEARARGERVWNFTVGEPDFEAAASVRQAAHDAIDAGHTKYTPTAGSFDLREAVAAYYSRRHGTTWSPHEAMVSAGAKQVLWNALASLVDPGDEVVLIAPYWTSYAAYVQLLGGVTRVVRPPVERDFKARGDDLRAVLGPRTRVVLFNNPVNPTGAVYSEAELRDLFAPLLDTDIVVITDEIYERLIFEGEHHSLVQVYPQLRERCVIATGASKSFAMTGWRVGFGLGPAPLLRAMINLQSHMTGNPNSVAQRAALAALQLSDADLEPMREHFRVRRDTSLQVLRSLPELRCTTPRGTFYVFMDVSAFFGTWQGGRAIEDSDRLAQHLLEKHGVAVVAGTAFDHAEGVRVSFTLPVAELEAGLGVFVRALRERA